MTENIGGDVGGLGGGMGILGILVILALCGGGFGNGGANRTEDMIMSNMNSRFNAQESAAEMRFQAQANNINHVEATEAIRDAQMQICNTDMLILGEGHKNALIEKDSQFLAAENTCKILAAQAAGTQAILDKMSANEIQALRDQIADLKSNVAHPAYITYAPGQAVFPPYPAASAAAVYGAYGLGGGCGAF